MKWTTTLTETIGKLMKKETQSPPPATGGTLFYNEILIDHFQNPRSVGEMDDGEADGYAVVGDPTCGDQMKLWIAVQDGRIGDVKFRSFGCPGAIATSSMVTELARGRTLEEAEAMTDDDVVAAFEGIPEHKKHCSLLGIHALHAAIDDYRRRRREDDLP